MGTNNKIPRPMIERLIEKLDVGLCWEFTASLTNGYGYIGSDHPDARKLLRVHRAMWTTLVGPIPTGLELDHLCRNRKCCNPDHLEPVTRRENVRRGSRGPAVPRRRKTHCIRRHAFTPHNTIVRKDGSRACRACGRLRYKAEIKEIEVSH